ncbi:hypothetical protein DPEC_G00307640 [Dallia pectoralis]|uniref:Uncharacterized protein n=1 Tax=Dallia pectoralis TaxID=75939 RepID=A0ACC2FEA6_DALPE|nr:hypothetical protein DPEC_G00307640 [Dallia pectoralis]
MSRQYDTLEPSVMDEKMLQKAVEEQGPQGQAGQIAKEEGIQYDEVCQLRLDYRNILKIDHLWQFTSLTKLQLDNNVIVKIEGLECLTNLKWLDLSFNNIEVIEGLNSLVLLEDLSLYNNRITVIENMDKLLNLHILSLGNNVLAQLENVIYLRKFKNLHTLNLAGNPICNEDHYKIFVAAYLPELVYLDFRLLNEETRQQANAKYQYAIEETRHNETQEREAMEARKEQDDQFQLHKDAFVENLNGSYLFDSIQLVMLCVQMFDTGLAQLRLREDELKSFFDCSREAVKENQQRATQIVADFEKARRQVMSEMQQTKDTHLLETQLNHCGDEICQLSDSLMTQELQLVDQLEDITKDFERNISDLVAGFMECRDLENHHHEKLLEIAVATLERVAKNELEEDIPDDVRMLFVDKDTVINAVSASHDTHLLKIDNREDELVTRIHSWISTLIKSIQDKEVKRNCKRIAEIHNYIDYSVWSMTVSLRDTHAFALIMPVRADRSGSSSTAAAFTSSASLIPPPPINTYQPGVATSLLYSGSQFRGHQKSKGNAYDVEVVLQYVCLLQYVTKEDSYVCGYLKIKGLTEEYPTLTTFFAGEIISRKRPFLTRKWDADEDVDRKHWGKFQAFYQYSKCFNSDDFDYEELKNSDFVFMRWKEQFLVPDHTIKDISGASFAGFYYICFQKSTASIEGYYYHRSSEWYQSLNLTHVQANSMPIYEFR